MSIATLAKELLEEIAPHAGKLDLGQSLGAFLQEQALLMKGRPESKQIADALRGLNRLAAGKGLETLSRAESYSIGRIPSVIGNHVRRLGNGEIELAGAHAYMSDRELIRELLSPASFTANESVNEHREIFLKLQSKAIDFCKECKTIGVNATAKGR